MENNPISFYHDGYKFLLPSNAQVFHYQLTDKLSGLEIHMQQGEAKVYIEIEPYSGRETPEQAARKQYETAAHPPMKDNLPPYEYSTPAGAAWRCRVTFVDGFQVPFLADLTFLQAGSRLYRVLYRADPDVFFEFLPEFEKMLDSLVIDQSSG